MKICILTSSYPLNPDDGKATAGIFVRDFALQLAREKHQVYIFTQARRGNVRDDKEITVKRFSWNIIDKHLVSLNPLNPYHLYSIFTLIQNGKKEAIRFVENNKINLCLAMWAIPGGYFAHQIWKKLKIPYAVWALGSDIWTWGKYPVVKHLVRKILKEAKYVFADGKKLAGEVKKLAGVDCQFIPNARPERYKIAPETVIDKSVPNFIFSGRWEKNKGVDILLEAIRLFAKDGYRAIFHLFGGGSLESKLRKKIKKYCLDKYIIAPGYVMPSKVTGYLKTCDCLIIPSRKESIPLILSEGIKVGIPLIVTDVGDMGELIKRHQLGEVVPSENPLALKKAMERMMDNSFLTIRKNIDELYKEFDLKKIVEQFLNSTVTKLTR